MLDKRSRILNFDILEHPRCTPLSRTYTVKREGRIIQALISFLMRCTILEPYYERSVTYERVRVDLAKVSDLIAHLTDELYRRRENEPTTVIIGFDKYRELELEIQRNLIFDMQMRVEGDRGPRVLGLNIMLSPYIDGIIVF